MFHVRSCGLEGEDTRTASPSMVSTWIGRARCSFQRSYYATSCERYAWQAPRWGSSQYMLLSHPRVLTANPFRALHPALSPRRQPSLYSAPELALYGRASFATDSYAFAVLLWELAHGRALPELLTRPEGAAAREWLSKRHCAVLPQQAGTDRGRVADADEDKGGGVGALPADALVWPEGTPAGCVELAGECLREEAGLRPSFEGICGRLEAILQELGGS